ncbi:MAG: UDP-N-acetylglucosamine 1-carboxyvinyltransferase [Alphaproteobacteria bacterium]|nr:UDP-N-acetylglucosamine 1-carboxyvinyltransferase [Alphaproteobacteria bacterium]
MDRIRIIGGTALNGRIKISGAKNAALPLMAACLLSDEELTLTNLPHLADIMTMTNLLAQHGVRLTLTDLDGGALCFNASHIFNLKAPYEIVRKMRASILVLGPLLARFGKAKVSLPGGCAIGTRPVDLHLSALEKMGAEIKIKEGYIVAFTNGGKLKGAEIVFPKVTVGGTENILMAAVLAEGRTVIKNAAREPEITDLAECLIKMGAQIQGLGTDTLIVDGVERLHAATHKVIADRIEAASYAIAAAITRGKIELTGVSLNLLSAVAHVLIDIGVTITETENGFITDAQDAYLIGTDVMTEPYPGFPTDVQAQLTALLTTVSGASLVTESIFENRFMHVPELARMGANINVHGVSSAIIRGVSHLSGAEVMATDLRASMGLVLAGLAAEGETIVNRVYHLDRGYEHLEDKLSSCGAHIERLHGE